MEKFEINIKLKNFFYLILIIWIVIFYFKTNTFVHELGHKFFGWLAGIEGHIEVFWNVEKNYAGQFVVHKLPKISKIQEFFFFMGWVIFEFLYGIVILVIFYFLLKKEDRFLFFFISFSILFICLQSFHQNILIGCLFENKKDSNWEIIKNDWYFIKNIFRKNI